MSRRQKVFRPEWRRVSRHVSGSASARALPIFAALLLELFPGLFLELLPGLLVEIIPEVYEHQNII